MTRRKSAKPVDDKKDKVRVCFSWPESEFFDAAVTKLNQEMGRYISASNAAYKLILHSVGQYLSGEVDPRDLFDKKKTGRLRKEGRDHKSS